MNQDHNIQMHNSNENEDRHVSIQQSPIKILQIQHNRYHQYQRHEIYDHIYRLSVPEIHYAEENKIYEIQDDQVDHQDYCEKIFCAS